MSRININMIEKVAKNTMRRLVNEGYLDDEFEEDSFEVYENDYPNDNVDMDNIGKYELIDFCKSFGDYLYIINIFGRWRVSSANSDEIQYEILNDLHNASFVEHTHDFDYLLYNRRDWFEDYYVGVYLLKGIEEEYAIVYMQEK